MHRIYTLFASLLVASFSFAQIPCSDLIISEYVEGYGNNKAIEIYNPTSAPINLSTYQIARYSNGATFPSPVWLSGTLQPNGVLVVVLDKRDPQGTGLEDPIDLDLEARGDLFINNIYDNATSAMYFNGNDAVAILDFNGNVVDVLGIIGQNPGTAWNDGNGVPWTQNKTLVRKQSVDMGDQNGFDAFLPEVEWDSLPVSTYTGLGSHISTCVTPPCPTPPNVSYAGLNTNYSVFGGDVVLVGSPSGGTFHGAGMSGNTFSPNAAGVGTHSVVYTYEDGNGCVGAYALCTNVDLSVGMDAEDFDSRDGLEFYPNPGVGYFNLQVSGFEGVVSYTVYDASGHEVVNDSFVGSSSIVNESINLNEMANGVYTVQVQTSKGLFSEKFVKQ